MEELNIDALARALSILLSERTGLDIKVKAEKRKEMKETGRILLEDMPLDRDGCHATGYCVCLGNPSDPADWWNEYEDEDGDLHYMR